MGRQIPPRCAKSRRAGWEASRQGVLHERTIRKSHHRRRTQGRGVHRYDFDGRYAYISPTAEGYIGNILVIYDLERPARPGEMSRWWMPGRTSETGSPVSRSQT